MSITGQDAKTGKTSIAISCAGLIVSILAVAISIWGFLLSKSNSPLILNYQEAQLSCFPISDTENKVSNIHTPSISDVKETSDQTMAVFISETNVLNLNFKITQGNISRVFKVDFSDNDELLYTKVEFAKGKGDLLTISIPISRKDISIRDSCGPNSCSLCIPGLQSFALAVLDYNDNLYIYYVLLRPEPVLVPNGYSFVNAGNDTSKRNIIFTKLDNWVYNIAFVDCSITNSKSIQKNIIDSFNTPHARFRYDEYNDRYVSTFVFFSDVLITDTSSELGNIDAKTLVVYDELPIERNMELIKAIPQERLT